MWVQAEAALDRAFYDTGCSFVCQLSSRLAQRTAGNGVENMGIGEASAVRRNRLT
ncbi:MAG: hypothetical protein R3E79_34910 [Caldilineaceae bacterium]